MTLKLYNHTIFPGEVDTAAPSSNTNIFVLTPPAPGSSCPTGVYPLSRFLCNSFGTLNFYNVSAVSEHILTDGGTLFPISTQILTAGTQGKWATPSAAKVDVSGNLTSRQLITSSTTTNGEWVPCIKS